MNDLNRQFFNEDIWMANKYLKRCSTPLAIWKSKPQWDVISYALECLLFYKTTEKRGVWKGVRKGNHHTLFWKIYVATTVGNNLADILKV